ncbi:unnamed protein product [Camellia sinensis]
MVGRNSKTYALLKQQMEVAAKFEWQVLAKVEGQMRYYQTLLLKQQVGRSSLSVSTSTLKRGARSSLQIATY